MTSCDRVREQLSLYAVGGLSRRARAELARHLAACPACASESAALARTGDLLSSVTLESAPAALLDSVRREVLARPRSLQTGHFRRARRVAYAAAALAVLATGGVLLRPHQAPAPPVRAARSIDDDVPAALQAHFAAQWSTPLADEAAVGLRMLEEDDG